MSDLAASIVMPSAWALPEQEAPPLSQQLRAGTGLAHKDLELRLGLPGCIRSLDDYRECLLSFYQLYRPIEIRFRCFSEWAQLGIDPFSGSLSGRLAADLRALRASVPGALCAPGTSLPPLPDFSSALGACYVMEGSALGAQFLLPQLRHALGDGMNGADSFFRGRGTGTSAHWKSFRAAIDRYGFTYPERASGVVSGAVATFKAIGLWMRPASNRRMQR